MNRTVKKLFTLGVLLTFLAVGAFGFMFMMHQSGSAMAESCPIGTALPECPVSIFAHLDAWRGITFDFSQIFLLIATSLMLLFTIRKSISGFLLLLEHQIYNRISRKISELQFLYSILLSDGIIHSKITPDNTY